jgi:hypothetical protein
MSPTDPKTPKTATQRINRIVFQPAMKMVPMRRTTGTKYTTHVNADKAPTTTANT